MTSNCVESISLKEKGNECVKESKFEEAVLHYSQAIQLDPNNSTLYSNRSLAFLKLQQFFHAFKDAQESIKLRPDWAKGYFRKGEVEVNAGRPFDALLSYKIALQLQPSDQSIKDAVARANLACEKEKRKEQVPWLCAGVGIIIGVAIVIADQLVAEKPSISHPLFMALLTISIAIIVYILAQAWKFYEGCRVSSLLDPPLDLLMEMENNENAEHQAQESPVKRSHFRLSKAQSRVKLKKCKK